MAHETVLKGTYPANANGLITGVLTDLDGTTPVAGSALNTLVLTLYEALTGAVINSCRQRNIKGVATVDETGHLSVMLAAEDMALVAPEVVNNEKTEGHVALVEWTWASPTRSGRHWILFKVAEGPAVAAA